MKRFPEKILIAGISLVIAALLAIAWLFWHLQKDHIIITEPLHLFLTGLIILTLISSIIIFRIAQKEIVNRREAESQINHLEQVQEKTAGISNVFERVTDAFIALDKNWQYTYLNKKAEELHGRKSEDLIGKNIWIEFPDVVKEPFYDALHEAMQSQEARRLQLYYSTTDRWFEDLIYPSSDGVSVYYHDITERKKAEEELKRSKENYFSLINTVDGIVWEADARSLQFSFVSGQAEKLLGYSVEQWVNEPAFWKDHIHPEDQNWAVEYCIEKTRLRKNHESEYRVIAADGHIVWMRNIVSVIVENEQPVQLRGIMVDITERRVAENNLKASEKKLQQVLSSIAESFYVIDRNSCVKIINEVAQKNLKIAWGKPITIGTNILDHIPAEKHEPIKSSLDRVFTGEKVEYELHLSFKDLPPWVLVSYTPIYDAEKTIIGASIITKDIAERKKAEEQIRESENKFRELVDTAPDATVIVNENGIIQIVNRQTEILLDYRREELIGQPVEILIPEGFRNMHNNQREKFHTEINMRSIGIGKELFALKKDGTKVPVEISLSPCHSDEGILITASIRDISERRKAEQMIRENEKQLSIATQIAKLGYWEYDIINDLFTFNDQFYAIYKTTVEKAGGYTMSLDRYADLFVYPDDKPVVRIENEKAIKTSDPDFNRQIEHRGVYANGETGYVSVHFFVVKDDKGRTIKTFGVNQDITGRKKAEEDLQRSNNRFELITRTTNDAVWEWNLETGELWANEMHQHLYGLTQSDPVPTVKMWAEKLHPDDRYAILKRQEETLASDKNVFISEYRFKVEGKGYSDIYDRCYILRDKKGKPIRMMGSMMDITERKKAQYELEQSYKAIRQLTEHLQNIREEERIHIAREIHDELGQQLTVMKMDISWLNKKIIHEDDLVKQKLKSLNEILDGTVKTVRRISSELRPSLLDDLGLVATMEWQLNEFEQRSGIKTLLIASETEIQLPDAVKTGLYRILQESLTNVARHAQAKTVKVSLKQKAGKILLDIEDDGKGFDKKKTAGKRTLGILGMKERTLMMGGEYEIQSILGKGTTVLVAIPEHS